MPMNRPSKLGKLSKCKIKVGKQTIEAPFNPSSFRKSVGVEYAETAGATANYPIMQYSGGTTPEIPVEFYLNARTEGHDLRGFINLLQDTLPWERTKPPFNTPPQPIIFAYGWFVKKCRLTNLDIEYTMFDKNLEPIEAKVSMTLKVLTDMGGKI